MRTDATTAEMVKVMENTFRDVNVALANEFALIAERIGVDVWEAIRLANHHPRVNVLRPGPGVGGHCIAVDPWFLVDAAPDAARLIRTARAVNDAMPEHVVARLAALVSPPAPIALLGVTYKAEVDDIRESPALRVAELAVERGYAVRLCDPHVKADTPGLPAPLLPLEHALRDAEADRPAGRPPRLPGARRRPRRGAGRPASACSMRATPSIEPPGRRAAFDVSVLGSGRRAPIAREEAGALECVAAVVCGRCASARRRGSSWRSTRSPARPASRVAMLLRFIDEGSVPATYAQRLVPWVRAGRGHPDRRGRSDEPPAQARLGAGAPTRGAVPGRHGCCRWCWCWRSTTWCCASRGACRTWWPSSVRCWPRPAAPRCAWPRRARSTSRSC